MNSNESGNAERPLICTEVVTCGWRGDWGDAEPGGDCPDCITGIVSTIEECPPACPECGEVEEVQSDGSAHECLICGWTWGRPSGRGDVDPGRSLEPEVQSPGTEGGGRL